MLSVRGIYTGQEIKPLETIRVRPNVRVIITFLEDDPLDVREPRDTIVPPMQPEDRTALFLAKCGGWEDARSPEEIIAEIYASRTTSDRGSQMFQKPGV